MSNRKSLKVAIMLAWLAVPAAAAAQTLTLEVDSRSLESWISNNSAGTIFSDGHFIYSDSGILDPLNWWSIQDAFSSNSATLSAVLGSGAVAFLEFTPATNNFLWEKNLVSMATWPTGTRWSIGFPFGTSLSHLQSHPFDAIFGYTSPSNGIAYGSITFVPEPTCLTIAAIGLVGFVLTRRSRS